MADPLPMVTMGELFSTTGLDVKVGGGSLGSEVGCDCQGGAVWPAGVAGLFCQVGGWFSHFGGILGWAA